MEDETDYGEILYIMCIVFETKSENTLLILQLLWFVICALIKSGGNSAEATPVPIPNTEVKLRCAHDTWRATARESRSLPDKS